MKRGEHSKGRVATAVTKVRRGPLKIMSDYGKFKEAFRQLSAEVPALQAQLAGQLAARGEFEARSRLLQDLCECLRLIFECTKAFNADKGLMCDYDSPILELEERIASVDLAALGVTSLLAEQQRASKIEELQELVASFLMGDDSLRGLAHTSALDSGLLSLLNSALLTFTYAPGFRDSYARRMSLTPEEVAAHTCIGAEHYRMCCRHVVEVRR